MHRKASFAGSFYTDNANDLIKEVDSFIVKSEYKNIKNIKAIICPHAGYVYSGSVAGCAYRQIKDHKSELVLVLALSHRGMLKHGNYATVIPDGTFETPVGISAIDDVCGHKLLSFDGFTFQEDIHTVEHSLEVQMPFIQRILPSAKIVPVIISTTRFDEMKHIAEILHSVFSLEKRSFMTIISTDLSHFHSYDAAVEIDRRFIDCLTEFNPAALYNLIAEGKAEACGIAPVLAGMMFAQKLGADKITEIQYKNSGDTAGDRNRVVGYLSAAIHGGQ